MKIEQKIIKRKKEKRRRRKKGISKNYTAVLVVVAVV